MNPLTDNELEQLLQDYGSLPPTAIFTYRKPRVAGRRMAAILLVALLSLLLVALTIGIASRSDSAMGDVPPAGIPTLQPPITGTPSAPAITTNRKPVTTPTLTTPPPTTPPQPPKTEPPELEALLPAWYTGASVQLVNLLRVGSSTDLFPSQLDDRYSDYTSFELNLGKMTHTIRSGDLVELKGTVDGHRESYCQNVYLRLSDGTVLCLGHALQNLWSTVGIDPSTPDKIYVHHTSPDGEQYVLSAFGDSESYGYFLYRRQKNSLQKIPYDLANSDSVSYSSNCQYIVVATPRPTNILLNDLWLIDTSSMKIKLICTEYDTFGESSFSADQRFVYTYLRIGDSVEKNEYGQWVMYDTQTGLAFCGEGEICYLQNGILISRTPDKFCIYDCATGEILPNQPDLPWIIHADQKDNRYTLTVYNPQTGLVEATLTNVGTYAISQNQQYLFYYTDKALGVTVMDLISGQSVSLPVSEAFLKETNPEAGDVIYSMMISDNGSKIILGYRISLEDYMERKQREITALQDSIHTSFLSVNSIPDFWKKFAPYAEQYAHLIEWTGYYLHENYAIYMIAYQNNGLSLTRSVGVLNIVEDYRDGSFTMYYGSESLYFLGNPVARSAWEDKVQLFRRTLKGNYDATCALLPTLGESREFYFDYAKCYDAAGKWSDDLKNAYRYSYEFMRQFYVRADADYSPEELESVLRILDKYSVNQISLSSLTVRRVAQINLYGPSNLLLYCGDVYISSTGKYYIQNTYGGDQFLSTGSQITSEEYETLMQATGGFLVETGLYKDTRIASIEKAMFQVYNDFLVSGYLPKVSGTEKMVNALSMIREGGYDTDEILRTLYPDPSHQLYIKLLAEYKIPFDRTIRYAPSVALSIRITIVDGVITLSDPSATAQ